MRPLYARLGRHLRQELASWKAAVFTANPELAAYLGLNAERSDELYNGPLLCKLLHFRPTAEMAQPRGEGAEMFANRLRKNLKHLGRWARREGIDCYRLYDADLPEYAVAIDLYQGETLWVHVQEYQAPASVDPEKALERLQDVLALTPEVLGIPAEQMYFKVRRRQSGTAQYEKQSEKGHFFEVREGRCRLLVNLSDYLDTGLFLDHRITRTMLEKLASGRDFLNLFAYTGAATVHAAMGGAASTTTVDLSNTYLEWARRNLALNGFSGPKHRLVQADCLTWLAEQSKRPVRRFGLIFLDPPTFSRSKRMRESFDVQRDHVTLLRQAARLLTPDGILIFSNNYRRFRLDAAALPELAIEEITRATLPKDFERRPFIHQCWKMTLAHRSRKRS